MKKYICPAVLLLATSLSFAFSSSPVNVSIEQVPLSDKPELELIVFLDIPEGIHVYASKTMFLDVSVERAENLGETKVTLPPSKPYENFDGTRVEVFSGRQSIIVRTPYTGRAGESFAIKGYFQYQGCSDTICYPPQKVPFSFEGIIPDNAIVQSGLPGEDIPYERGLWWGVIGAFLAGILLSLTPCVYPMIGITVAVIGAKQVSKRRTIGLTFMYILGLSLVYALVGIIVATVGSTAASFFRSPWILVPIGVLFVFLGLSMFDLFVIQTSSSFSARVQKFSQRYKGSYTGTFLLGALSAFVVGPCISGPIITLITFVATSGDIVRGFAYFFSLAWGMGMILFVAGTVSGALPRAGIWMERVKYTIGIVLIWAGFYFTRPFTGEIVFVSASIVAFALGLNTLGVLSLPAGKTTPRRVLWTLLGATVLGIFAYTQIAPLQQAGHDGQALTRIDLPSIVETTSMPIILDFWAPWCAICKEIEATVLSKPEIRNRLQDYTFVRVDYDSNPHLVKKFNIIGPPAFIFLDSNGNQVGHVTVTGEELEKRIFSEVK